jgi:hypothetical protein
VGGAIHIRDREILACPRNKAHARGDVLRQRKSCCLPFRPATGGEIIAAGKEPGGIIRSASAAQYVPLPNMARKLNTSCA